MINLPTIIKPLKPPTNLKTLGNQLSKASTPEAVLDFEHKVSAYEAYMRKAGFNSGDLHEINEHRMRARWKLGQLLVVIKRAPVGKRRGSEERAVPQNFNDVLKSIKLEKPRAIEAQRISHLPKIELEKCFRRAREKDEMVTISGLVSEARPYWYKEQRKQKHKIIKAKAKEATAVDKIGPFPLIYADPPWTFEVFSEKGKERSAESHYPTLSDSEIEDFTIDGISVDDLAHKDAALFLWCTSSNLLRALAIMLAWGFQYKTQAVWDKQKIGTGYVFRNRHEILLYGTRGKMSAPQFQPPSVFSFPRGRHSSKPLEIRKAIEKMYPDFDEATRIELFARNESKGWTTRGFELV